MARYFRISINNTNTNGPFDVFYNTSNGGVLDFATLYPSGGDATNLSKSLFTGGNTVSIQVPDNVFSIQVIQQSPYVISNIFLPIPITPSPTAAPTTAAPTTAAPTTAAPTTAAPTTSPTTAAPTTAAPTTAAPTTAPTTAAPTTASPTQSPTTAAPTTAAPTTAAPTTAAPTTAAPTTASPTTASPTTAAPTTAAPTTASPTTASPTTAAPTTASPTTSPTTAAPTTAAPTTASPTTAPTTAAPTTAAPTTAAPTTAAPTTAAPTTAAPTGAPSNVYIHLEEYNASPTTFLDANMRVDGTYYYFSGDFSTTVAAGSSDTIQLEAAEATPSNFWGPYTTGSAKLSVYENGSLIYNNTYAYYSGSGSQLYNQPITYGAGKTYVISGSTLPVVGCYNVSISEYTTGECYYFPNEYESVQTVTVTLNAPAFTDVRVSGSLTNGTPFDTIIPAGYDSTILWNATCGCGSPCLTGDGISEIWVTSNEGTVSIPVCGAPINAFRELFPTGSLFITAMSYNCVTPSIRFNFTGGIAPYSASISRDVNGNQIWSYTNITTTPFDATSIPSGQIYYPAIKDAAGVIVEGSPIYDCATLDATFKIDNSLNLLASGNIYYPALPFIGSQNKGTIFTATGSKNTLVSVTAVVDSSTTFLGWSYISGSKTNIFNTGNTIQVPLTNTGSIYYAIIDRNVVSASFCYYNSDPVGSVDCEACAVTSSVYFNGYSLTGSNYANVNWYSDVNLTTLVNTGYYKLSNAATSTPIYYVSGNPVQTRTENGFCSDVILPC